MLRDKSIRNALIIDTVVFVAWLALVLIFADYDTVGIYFWAGVIGTTFAYVVALVSRLLERPMASNAITEVNFITALGAEAYLVITTVINTIFVLLANVDWPIFVPVFVNLILFVVFFAARLYAKSYQDRITTMANVTTNKTLPHVNMSRQLGIAMSIAKSPVVKKQLVALKESVDYGNTISSSSSRGYDDEFLNKIDEIQNAIRSNCPDEQVLKLIDDADVIWKCRTSIITATK